MLRSKLRQSINDALAQISGRSTARMRWSLKAYLDEVFFGLDIQFHWVPYLLFTNLSRHTGLPCIMHITTLWETGCVIYFSPVTDEEREAARRDPLSAASGPLHLGLPEWYERNGPKSAKTVSAELEVAANTEVEAAKEPATTAETEDIEEFSDDEERRELVRRECRARGAGELLSDPTEDWAH
ncbi:hypothetical protein GSI_04449 [Ganoderma sinense ZZ0214-1]|uniref:Uncharacterized protein n=1 Tax=Ganoderma sinense ZZ0214-1 TaxID=1077348 RepID=A0A2G8SGV0_9APHY|nr:hypothetical protein GSI_04449 [Ganoderma sinense ZZ0214-1]